MSKTKTTLSTGVDLGITLRGAYDSEPVVTFVMPRDIFVPDGQPERLEWIRKSYERFLAKVIEKEELIGAPPAEIV